jgi:hypothetical protein
LFDNSPPELLSVLPEAILSICNSISVVPDCLLPVIVEIACRFGPAVFSPIRDRRAIVFSLKSLLDKTPDQVQSVALFVIDRSDLWQLLAEVMHDLPLLASALCQFISLLFTKDRLNAPGFIGSLGLPDFYAKIAIADIQPYLPEHFDVFCKLALAGDLTFRTAAVYCSREITLFSMFCQKVRSSDQYFERLLSVVGDYVIMGNTETAIKLLYEIASNYAVGYPERVVRVGEFTRNLFQNLPAQNRSNLIVCLKILCFVHPHAALIRPIIGDVVDGFEARVADLTFRYLWTARTPNSANFLVFRLRLLRKRISQRQTPKFWTDEMLQMK